MNFKFIIFLSFLFSVTSCLPFIKMESGRTLEKGKNSIGLTATSYRLRDSNDNENLDLPYLEVKYKRGLTDKFQFSLGMNSIGFIMADTKYQIVGDKTSFFALSIGVGADALLIIPNYGSKTERNIKVSIPLYSSIHLNEKFYFFLNPQYSRQYIFGDNDINFLGASIGLGYYLNRGEVNLGGTYFKPLGNLTGNLSQIGLSYRYNF